jgi:hypothetical protein
MFYGSFAYEIYDRQWPDLNTFRNFIVNPISTFNPIQFTVFGDESDRQTRSHCNALPANDAKEYLELYDSPYTQLTSV